MIFYVPPLIVTYMPKTCSQSDFSAATHIVHGDWGGDFLMTIAILFIYTKSNTEISTIWYEDICVWSLRSTDTPNTFQKQAKQGSFGLSREQFLFFMWKSTTMTNRRGNVHLSLDLFHEWVPKHAEAFRSDPNQVVTLVQCLRSE